jgi:flavin reductase (DIM6/NTAB) family NADH-FMN oxidoreductase RutF
VQIEEFKKAVGKFPTGVTVISTNHGGKLWGFTANSFVSVSLDPQLISFSLSKKAGSFSAFSNAEYFLVNILASDQAEISKHFAHKSDDKFANIDYRLSSGKSLPLINGSVCYIECSKFKQLECGDHVMFIGEVLKAETDEEKSPLVYFAKTYREL